MRKGGRNEADNGHRGSLGGALTDGRGVGAGPAPQGLGERFRARPALPAGGPGRVSHPDSGWETAG